MCFILTVYLNLEQPHFKCYHIGQCSSRDCRSLTSDYPTGSFESSQQTKKREFGRVSQRKFWGLDLAAKYYCYLHSIGQYSVIQTHLSPWDTWEMFLQPCAQEEEEMGLKSIQQSLYHSRQAVIIHILQIRKLMPGYIT